VRFVVYGAGAIGGLLGARLTGAGHDVMLVARGAHGEAIRARGLEVVEADGSRGRYAVPAVGRIADARVAEGDVVLLAMKSQDTEAALRELVASAPPDTPVACVQNGVENERVALRLFPRVYGVLVLCPAVHLEPGVVESNAAPLTGILDIGRVPHGSDALAEEVAGALRDATYLSEVHDDILAWKWAKLLDNLANAVIALSGTEAARSDAARLVREEAVAVLAGSGVEARKDELAERTRLLPRQLARRAGNSSWQSVERGTGSIETDYLNGEIVLLARRHGLPAPANELMQELTRRLVLAGSAPGSMPLGELERLLGAAVG
jgi:2-dehydropantoate 2-reductase